MKFVCRYGNDVVTQEEVQAPGQLTIRPVCLKLQRFQQVMSVTAVGDSGKEASTVLLFDTQKGTFKLAEVLPTSQCAFDQPAAAASTQPPAE